SFWKDVRITWYFLCVSRRKITLHELLEIMDSSETIPNSGVDVALLPPLNANDDLTDEDSCAEDNPCIDNLPASQLSAEVFVTDMAINNPWRQTRKTLLGPKATKKKDRGEPVKVGSTLPSTSSTMAPPTLQTNKEGITGTQVAERETTEEPENDDSTLPSTEWPLMCEVVPLKPGRTACGKMPSYVRCKAWLEAMGREDLKVNLPKKLHNNFRVCADHFEDKYFSSTLRTHLNREAIPCKVQAISIGQEEEFSRLRRKNRRYTLPLHVKPSWPQPSLFESYNNHIGGIERGDQNVSLYWTSIRGKKWYFLIIAHLIDVAEQNAWLLYRRNEENIDLSFQRRVATAILESNKRVLTSKGRPSKVSKIESWYDGRDHYISDLPVDIHTHKKKQLKGKICQKKATTMCLKYDLLLHVSCFVSFHINELKKMNPVNIVIKILDKLNEEGYKETGCEMSRKELEIVDDIYDLLKSYESEAVEESHTLDTDENEP
ncbi:hypothetical protein ANN_07419, partial [Periplaneta americana]